MFGELNWGNKEILIASAVPCFILSKLTFTNVFWVKRSKDELGKPHGF